MDTREEQLMHFILNSSIKKRFTKENLDYSLSIEEDLGISEDWAEDFLCNYSNTFGVDLSNFSFGLYFYTDGPFLYCLYKLFPRLNPKKKKLTIGDLVAGIKAGRLDEDVINASKESKEI